MIWYILYIVRKYFHMRWPHFLYTAYLRSQTWKRKRKAAIKRAAGRCEQCSCECAWPEVHHKTYKHLGAELSQDLLVLCPDCHRRLHHRGTYKAHPLVA